GSRMSPDVLPPGGAPDLGVDAFDYRRYTERAKIDALMRRLAPVGEVGGVSLLGLEGRGGVSAGPELAVVHRRPHALRGDGGPALPDVRITSDVVEEAARRMDYATVATAGGPIVYDPRLGYGRLGAFYQSLRLSLEAKGDREALAALEREIEEETRDRK